MVSAVAFGVLFVLLDPYMLVHLVAVQHQVGGRGAAPAGGSAKLGQSSEPGWVLLPAHADLGARLAAHARRRRRRAGSRCVAQPRGAACCSSLFPLLLLVFLGREARFFGRWFLPAYPALCVLAAYAAVRTVDALPAAWSRHKGVLVGVAAGLLAIQGLWSSVRVNSVFAKTDTRTLARQWIERSVPAGSGLVVEPAVFPKDFLTVGKPVKPTASIRSSRRSRATRRTSRPR